MNIARLTGLILTILLFAAACSGGGGSPAEETPEPDPLEIEISTTTTEVGKGGVVELTATLTGGDISDADIAWTANVGKFDDDTAAAPMWFAPMESGTANIVASATLDGETISANEAITVTSEEADWCATSGDMDKEDNPCVIYTVQQLEAIGAKEDRMAGHYVLGRDIDATETVGWDDNHGFVPIGSKVSANDPDLGDIEVAFSGTLDGNGFAISNLTINRPDERYAGVFAEVSQGAQIYSMILDNAKVTGGSRVGALIGQNSGAISNVKVVEGSITANYGFAGGLIGHNMANGKIEWIHMQEQTVEALDNSSGGTGGTEPAHAAGLVAQAHGSIENVLVQDAEITGKKMVGGITAYTFSDSEIYQVVVMDSRLNSTGNNAGGLVAYGNGQISHSSARNNEITGEANVGGAVGFLEGSIDQTFVFAPDDSITGQGISVGGLVGDADKSAISQSYVYVEEISGMFFVGGLVGGMSADTTITESAAFGIALDGSSTGGLFAHNAGDPNDNVEHSYYLDTLAPTLIGGIPLTEQAITEAGSYSWGIGPGEDWVMPSSDQGPFLGPDLTDNSRYDDPIEAFENMFD